MSPEASKKYVAESFSEPLGRLFERYAHEKCEEIGPASQGVIPSSL